MNDTNGWDALAIFIGMTGMVALCGIGAYLAVKGHQWFAFFVILIAGCLRVKTGS